MCRQASHLDTRLIYKMPRRFWRCQTHHMFEHRNGIVELHGTIAIKVSGQGLVRRQSCPVGVNWQADDHFQDGNRIVEVDLAILSVFKWFETDGVIS